MLGLVLIFSDAVAISKSIPAISAHSMFLILLPDSDQKKNE
jgi:hypothetical protein